MIFCKFRAPDFLFAVKNELLKLFPEQDAEVINLAVESADFNLETAARILTNSLQQDQYTPAKRNIET